MDAERPCGLPAIASSVATALVLLSCWGCAVEPVRVGYEDDLAAGRVPTWEEFLAQAEPVEGSDSFVFEGDMVVSEDTLFAIYQARYMDEVDKLAVSQSQVWVGRFPMLIDNKWSEADASDLTYCVSDAWGDEKPRALADFREASAQWMSAADVTFRYVPSQDDTCTSSNAGVKFNVIPGADGSSGLACFPHESCRFVRMNYDSFFDTYTWLGAWTHEIGHRLGFIHEHYQACGGGTGLARFLTDYDQVSTMHYSDAPHCGIGHSGQLSALDRQGSASLYGAPSSTALQVTPAAWLAAAVL